MGLQRRAAASHLPKSSWMGTALLFLPVNEKSVVHVVDRRCNLGKYNFGLWGLSVWPLFARQSSKQLATVGIFHDQV